MNSLKCICFVIQSPFPVEHKGTVVILTRSLRPLDKGRERESVLIKLMISDIGIAKSELYLYNYVTPLEISSQ